MTRLPAPGGALGDFVAEELLQAWGAHKRAEVRSEVGLPAVSPYCVDYEAPDWERQPTGVPLGELLRSCAAMTLMRARKPRLYRDIADHYRDGARISWRRRDEGRRLFGQLWLEADPTPDG